MKKLITAISLCFVLSPVFALDIPYDGVSATISTTTATLFSYPCSIDGMSISNDSENSQTVIVYDGSTEIYKVIASSQTNIPAINFKKKISTSIKAKASPSNLDATVRLYIGIK